MEAAPEEMAGAPMAAVELLRVETVEALESPGQALLRRLDDQVVVSSHETEGMASPFLAPDRFGEKAEECDSIGVVAEDLNAVYSARGHVVHPIGKVSPKWARHVSTVGFAEVSRPTRRPFCRFSTRTLPHTTRPEPPTSRVRPSCPGPRGHAFVSAGTFPPLVASEPT